MSEVTRLDVKDKNVDKRSAEVRTTNSASKYASYQSLLENIKFDDETRERIDASDMGTMDVNCF